MATTKKVAPKSSKAATPRRTPAKGGRAGQAAKKKYFEGVGRRKTAVARVRFYPGVGSDFIVNGLDYKVYFPVLRFQKKAIAPLGLASAKGGVEVKVRGGGVMAGGGAEPATLPAARDRRDTGADGDHRAGRDLVVGGGRDGARLTDQRRPHLRPDAGHPARDRPIDPARAGSAVGDRRRLDRGRRYGPVRLRPLERLLQPSRRGPDSGGDAARMRQPARRPPGRPGSRQADGGQRPATDRGGRCRR